MDFSFILVIKTKTKSEGYLSLLIKTTGKLTFKSPKKVL